MAKLVKIPSQDYFVCNKHPWGCTQKHKTLEEAKRCEAWKDKGYAGGLDYDKKVSRNK